MNDTERLVADVEAKLAQICGVLNVAHARLVSLTARLIDEQLWQGTGIRSVEHWLTWKAGLSRAHAHQVADVARRRAELPVTHQIFADGELSFDQVHAVTTSATVHDDAEVAAFAKAATVAQIRSTVSRYRFAADPADQNTAGSVEAAESRAAREQAAAAAAAAPAKVVMSNDTGRFLLRVDAPADQGALIEQALREAKDALFHAGQSHVGWVDALTEICNRSIGTVTSPARRDRFRTYLHLDTKGARLTAGPGIPPALRDKLTCDGTATPLWERDGIPVSVGRSQRIVPDRTRRLIQDRDRTCVVPGCGARQHLEVHHITHWLNGGPTDTANLALIRCACHDAHHRGELTITSNADQPHALHVTDHAGRPMNPAGTTIIPPPDPGNHPQGNGYQHPYGEPIQRTWVYFTPPDHQANAVDPQGQSPPIAVSRC